MAESSKQGSKRAKRIRNSMQAILRNSPSIGIHISDGSSNSLSHTPAQELPSPSTEESRKSKNTRGPTLCKGMPSDNEAKINVEWFEGQPKGAGSIKLSSYMGAVVRDMISIIYDDWRKVPENKKDDLWELIEQKFNLNHGEHKEYVRKDMARLLRRYRSELSTKVRAANEKGEDLADLKPSSTSKAEWDIFVRKRLSEDFKVRSDKFKNIRAKQVLPHTSSRKGYARLKDEMKKESSNPSSITRVDVWKRAHIKKSGEPSTPKVAEHFKKISEFEELSKTSEFSFKGDALAYSLGPERYGQVRGYGFGMTPSKLSLISESTTRIAELEEKMKEESIQHQHQMNTMNQQLEEMKNLLSKFLKNQDHGEMNQHVFEKTTYFSSQSQGGNHNFKIRDKCKLLLWFRPYTEVAKATWYTNDPSARLHNAPLGPTASKVSVTESIEPDAPLWMPTTDDVDQPTIQDVVGSFIAWPTKFIIPDTEG